MPTIRRAGPYRFYFYSGDLGEPRRCWRLVGEVLAHAGIASLQSWISARDLRAIERIVIEHRKEFVEAWNAYFGT